MRLTPPTKNVFYISVLAMIVGLVLYLFMDDMKDLGYYITLAGGALLTAGVALKGF
jgi:uncharacterized membrane protein YadS